jgi:hypothetical protein
VFKVLRKKIVKQGDKPTDRRCLSGNLILNDKLHAVADTSCCLKNKVFDTDYWNIALINK